MHENDGSLFKVDGTVLTTLTVDCAARVIDTALFAGRAEPRDGGVWLDDRAAPTLAGGLDDLICARVELEENREEHQDLLERHRAMASDLSDITTRMERLRVFALDGAMLNADDRLAAIRSVFGVDS